MLVDSHCHLDFAELHADLPALLARMAASEVTHALTISTTLAGFPGVRDLAQSQPNLWCTVGVHPDERSDEREASVDELVRLAQHPKVVAIGETGLDYFRIEGDAQWQRERFRVHVRAARECAKPLVIHTRQAAADTLRILEEEGADRVGGVMHCFTESLEVAQAAMKLGFYISVSGIVTFKNALALKEVVRQVPLDRMLVETDAPYLAPAPHRGRTNEPAFVRLVAEEVARLKGVSLETVAEATTRNFFSLFGPAALTT